MPGSRFCSRPDVIGPAPLSVGVSFCSMITRLPFLRAFLWLLGIQVAVFVIYLFRVVTTHGVMDWFQQGVWLLYGRVGGLLLLPLVPETWAGIGVLQLFAPLVSLVIYSFVLAVVFRMLRRSGES